MREKIKIYGSYGRAVISENLVVYLTLCFLLFFFPELYFQFQDITSLGIVYIKKREKK